uniref:EF-hand domain-containing protein n=1 Tax=Moniliophthora roreri TaxID=221103 RepID=A0A0W0F976_MONRR
MDKKEAEVNDRAPTHRQLAAANLDLPLADPVLSTSQEELHQPASPPYRAQASTSNLAQTVFFQNNPYSEYPPSPAYRSRVNMHEDEKAAKDRDSLEEKPKVHYHEDTYRPPSPYYHTQQSPSGPPSTTGTDDEDNDNDNEFDWSGEEDLGDEEAKFEQRMGVAQKKKGWSFKRIITLLFSSLIGSTFLTGVLVTPAILIHFYWYKENPTEHRRYIKDNVQAWLFWAAANLLISWYLALLVDVVPVVFTFIVAAVWGHISEEIKSRVELYNSIKNTAKPAFYAASGWASWVIIFGHIFKLYNVDHAEESRADYTRRMYQVVEFLFFFTLIVCAQKMLSHAIAFAFHRTAYKERLDDLAVALRTIEKLRDYRPKFAPTPGPSRPRSGLRTPLFGTPVIEKDHFHWKSSAKDDDGADADVEDGDKTVVGSSRKSTMMSGKDKGKKANRSSWMLVSGRRQATQDEVGPAGSTSHAHGASVLADKDHRSSSPTQDTHELGVLNRHDQSRPLTPSAGHSPSGTTPILSYSEPHNISPHRYPPTPGRDSPRPSVHERDASETLAAAAKALKTAVLHDARNIKGEEVNTTEVLGLGGVGSRYEAKRLARSIFYAFKPPNVSRNYLLPTDFHVAFTTPEEAETAFRVFDKDDNGDISRSEIKTTVLKVYKERRFLARSMRDVNAALGTLDKVLLFFALVILFFISLQVFGVEVGDSLASIYSIGIAASFVFKNAASNAFDAIMFLFVTHPFDTGDRVFVDEENLVVKKMGLFATVFTRVDGTETYYFNSQLFNKFITNVRRSGKTFENCTIQVAWRTPLEKIDALEACMNSWLSTEENRWFEPATSIMVQNIKYQKYLELTIGIGHNGTWQDWGLRVTRKTAFHAAVQYYCRQLGIIGHEAPLPIIWADEESDTYVPSEYDMSDVGSVRSTGADDAGGVVVSGDIDAEPERVAPGMPSTGVGLSAQPSQQRTAPPEMHIHSPSPQSIPPASASLMGFKAPEVSVAAHLRARKSKGRKAILRGMADG